MREIKFRAWDKKLNRFTNYRVGIFDDSIRFYDKHLGTWRNAGERFEIMQYTGLKDKNGVEIYEGDMFRGVRAIYIVKWEDYGFTIFDELGFKSSEIEVIGNIYENKEYINDIT